MSISVENRGLNSNLVTGVACVVVACAFVVAIFGQRVVGEGASVNLCVSDAETRQELDSCLDRQLKSVLERVDAAGAGIVRGFPVQPEMAEVVRIAKQGWGAHRDTYCGLVGSVAAGGQVKGELPIDAQKKYAACLIRSSEEFESALLGLAPVER